MATPGAEGMDLLARLPEAVGRGGADALRGAIDEDRARRQKVDAAR